ncbi:MAG: outer membrane beta-barrel protein [Pseudomonadales bacterium]|nr:outer membrane beta-barrel protein [Pseudomonadales bacterium]
MRIVTILLLSVSFLSVTARAEGPVGAVGYANLSDDDVSLGAITGSLGYRFDTTYQGFSVTPEVRIGLGINDDTYAGVDVELDSLYGFNVRAEWDLGQTYIFVAPSYTNVEVEASFGGITVSDDEWEFGGGLGFGYRLEQTIGLEVSYEVFDDVDVFSAGVRLDF